MNEQFQIIDAKEQPVLAIRMRTTFANLPQEIGKAYMAIDAYIQELGETPKDAPYTAYFNMDMEDLDVEMGFPVSQPYPENGDIKPGVIPAGKQAVAMFKGPYAKMEPTYTALTAWVAQQGQEPSGIVYEYYYNSPLEVPEDELLTKIVFILK
jgi:effector-binding domain-containing protein